MRIIVFGELEAVEAYLKVLSRNSSGGTEKIHETVLARFPVSRSVSQPGVSRIQVRE
jgi:hypothetical protein